MYFNGFFMTHNSQNGFDNLILRIKEVGINAYKYHKCIPESIITFKENILDYKKGDQVIYFKTDNLEINKMYLLGFGFEGLFEDEDKMNIIENFGKYRCIIKDISNCEIHDDQIYISKFEF